MKEVHIIGMGSTMIKCPFTAEVWGVNQTYKVAKRVDKLFITDPRVNFKGKDNHDFDELNSLGIPIISLHHFPEIKNFVHFPYDEIVENFGIQDLEFFTNTICYMIAYAIHLGYDKISLYGIDMATQLEYILERGGVEFWVGVAIGRGVKVTNTKGSMVCRPAMNVPYGHKNYVNMKEVDPFHLMKNHNELLKSYEGEEGNVPKDMAADNSQGEN